MLSTRICYAIPDCIPRPLPRSLVTVGAHVKNRPLSCHHPSPNKPHRYNVSLWYRSAVYITENGLWVPECCTWTSSAEGETLSWRQIRIWLDMLLHWQTFSHSKDLSHFKTVISYRFFSGRVYTNYACTALSLPYLSLIQVLTLSAQTCTLLWLSPFQSCSLACAFFVIKLHVRNCLMGQKIQKKREYISDTILHQFI